MSLNFTRFLPSHSSSLHRSLQALKHMDWSFQPALSWRLDEAALCQLCQVVGKDVKQVRTQGRIQGRPLQYSSAASRRSTLIKCSLSLTILPGVYPFHCPPCQTIISSLGYRNIAEDSVGRWLKLRSVTLACCSPHINKSLYHRRELR